MDTIKKITVAHIVHQLNIGGIENSLVNTLKNIDRNKVNFLFICSQSDKPYFYEQEILDHGGQIIKICSPKKNIFRHSLELFKIFKNKNIDIVHSHTMFHSGLVVFIAYLANIKLRITHSHSTISPAFSNNVIKKIMKLLINTFSNIKLACSDLAGYFLFGKTKKFIFFPNGINIDNFIHYDKQISNNLKNQLNIQDNDIVLGSVGRLTYQKNYLFLLEIANILIKENKNIKLVIAGEGELRGDLENYIENNHLEDNIILPGNIKNIPELLPLFDIFILPSINEGLPGVVIEAQAAGLNCLISSEITKNVDLGMGLIKFLDLNKGKLYWAETIKKLLQNKIYVDKNTRFRKMDQAGFNIKNLDLLYDIYKIK